MPEQGSSNSHPSRSSPEAQDPEAQPLARSRGLNQFTRRSFVGMFLLGRASVRHIARFHAASLPERGSEAVVEQELREEMIAGGALERLQRKPAAMQTSAPAAGPKEASRAS
jgi:hypothetical protein